MKATSINMVDLPLGATEDRVCGTIDIEKALTEGVKAFEPGLLVLPHPLSRLPPPSVPPAGFAPMAISCHDWSDRMLGHPPSAARQCEMSTIASQAPHSKMLDRQAELPLARYRDRLVGSAVSLRAVFAMRCCLMAAPSEFSVLYTRPCCT